jgi:hypothetical protein
MLSLVRVASGTRARRLLPIQSASIESVFPFSSTRWQRRSLRSTKLPLCRWVRVADHTETTLDPTDHRPATITRDSFRILGSFDTTPSLLSEIRPELQYCRRKIDIIVCSRRSSTPSQSSYCIKKSLDVIRINVIVRLVRCILPRPLQTEYGSGTVSSEYTNQFSFILLRN